MKLRLPRFGRKPRLTGPEKFCLILGEIIATQLLLGATDPTTNEGTK